MALNVKAALAICAGCIAAMSWLVQQVEVRAPGPWPQLVEAQKPLEPVLASASRHFAGNVEPLSWREGWVQRLARPNTMDREAEANRSTGRALALAAPCVAIDVYAPALPPLVTPSADDVVLAESTTDAPADDGLSVAPLAETAVEPPADWATADNDPAPGTFSFKRYRVARGDTLVRIASREYGTQAREYIATLLAHNPAVARRGGRLYAGEELLIPDRATAAAGGTVAAPTLAVAGEVPVRSVAGPTAKTDGERVYTIRKNDTLQSIARRLLDDPERWREIQKLNRDLDPRKIVPGMRIKLPPPVRVAAR